MREPVSKVMKRYNYLLGELNAVYHEMSLKLGLSDSAMIILYTICDNGNETSCLLQDICRRSGLSKQTINSAIRKLEGEGVIRLDATGGRGKNVHLTEQGRELARRTAVPLIELEDEIYTSWSREELQTYLELTGRFVAAIKEKVKQL